MFNITTRSTLLFAVSVGLLAGCGGVEEHLAPEQDLQAEPEVGTSEQAFLGADLCRDVNIRIRNSRDRSSGNVAIKVLRLKMYSEWDARWYSEDIPNRIVDYGVSVLIEDQDLENVYAEDLATWKVYYKVLQPNGTWGSTVYQTVTAQPGWECRDYRTYDLTVN